MLCEMSSTFLIKNLTINGIEHFRMNLEYSLASIVFLTWLDAPLKRAKIATMCDNSQSVAAKWQATAERRTVCTDIGKLFDGIPSLDPTVVIVCFIIALFMC